MTINSIIKSIMKEQHFTQAQMAEALGLSIPQEVSGRLASKNMTFAKAEKMLSILGYEVVVRKKRKGRNEANIYVVSSDDKEV